MHTYKQFVLCFPGIEYADTDLISVRIKALNPGKAKIQATVQLPGGQKISTFVEVVGKFRFFLICFVCAIFNGNFSH